MGEGVAVEEADSPVKDANETSQTAEAGGTYHVTGLLTLLAGYTAELAQAVDDCDDQAPKGDAAERV